MRKKKKWKRKKIAQIRGAGAQENIVDTYAGNTGIIDYTTIKRLSDKMPLFMPVLSNIKNIERINPIDKKPVLQKIMKDYFANIIQPFKSGA